MGPYLECRFNKFVSATKKPCWSARLGRKEVYTCRFGIDTINAACRRCYKESISVKRRSKLTLFHLLSTSLHSIEADLILSTVH